MLLTLVAAALAAQAAPLPPGNGAGITAAAEAEQIARAAQHLRGDATIATTLQSINVGKHDAEQALAASGTVPPTTREVRQPQTRTMTTMRASGPRPGTSASSKKMETVAAAHCRRTRCR
eukprot:SAG22_NODE_7899_length_699_cov_1.086667_1_plen_119_part_01